MEKIQPCHLRLEGNKKAITSKLVSTEKDQYGKH